MPLVLMQHSPEYTKYDDQIGEQYHYPSQYFDRIVEGEQFIYCRPKEDDNLTVYFGTGTIGTVRKDISKEGHRYCQIEDYFQFLNEVKYRDENGIYLETGSSQIPVMQSAVRVITDSAFHRIIEKSDIQKDEIFEHLLSAKTAKERIRALDEAYANATPKVKQYLTYRVERGTAIGGKVKDLNNYVCQTCGCKPFLTRTGKPYAEAHHVTPLHKLENGSMASQNVICVCANCHRKMHFGNVEIIKTTENDITFEINGSMITVRRNKLSAKIG